MKRKTTRLTFTEEEHGKPKHPPRGQKGATRAADRADKAKAKLSTPRPAQAGASRWTPTRPKSGAPSSASARRNLGRRSPNPSAASRGAEALLGGEAHRQVDKQNQDENAGVQAAHEGERLAEGAAKKLKDGKYSKKLKAYKKAERC